MLAVAENAGLSVNQVLADRQANLFETISKIYTADQMQNFLMDEVAVPVMDLLTEFRQSSSSELVKNVLALIKQTRGDITLNECADRLNYNPSYNLEGRCAPRRIPASANWPTMKSLGDGPKERAD